MVKKNLFLWIGGFIIFTVIVSILIIFLVKSKKSSVTPAPSSPPPAPPSPPPPNNIPSVDPNSSRWLDLHNHYRSSAWGPGHDLEWNNTLAGLATSRAQDMAKSNVFSEGSPILSSVCNGSSHPGGNTCGDNLEEVTGSGVAGPQAVTNWYNECPQYTGNPSHYTQVVWKDAKQVGCGMAGSMAVCVYDVGNELGQFATNVPPTGICKGN